MNRGLIKKLFGAAADQALLSIINLAISFVFIRYGTKAEYGLYILLLGPIYLAQGIQNAIFLSPYATRVAGGLSADKNSALSVVFWGQFLFLVSVALIGGLGLFLYLHFINLSVDEFLVTFFAFGIFGSLIREGVRAFQYAEGHVKIALYGNVAYAIVMVVFLGVSLTEGRASLSWLFAAMGLGGCFALLLKINKFPATHNFLGEFKEFWLLGRWAIVGVLFTWINSNFYPYFIAHEFGVDAVAEVNAARLFLMPFVLVLPAWSNLFRPMFARWYANGEYKLIYKIVYLSAFAGAAVLLIYGALASYFYPSIYKIFGDVYKDIAPLIGAWSAYYILFLVRTVYQAVLMVDQRGYRYLSTISTILFFCLWPVLWFGTHFGPFGVVLGLAFLELVQWALVRHQAVRYLKS